MATEISNCNVAGRIVDWVNELVLGSATHGVAAVRTSATLKFFANLRILTVMKLTSGVLTVDIDRHSGTPNFGSPDETLALTGTAFFVSDIALTDSERQISVRTTAGGAGAVVAKNLMVALDKLAADVSYHELVGAFNKVPQTTAYAPFALTAAA